MQSRTTPPLAELGTQLRRAPARVAHLFRHVWLLAASWVSLCGLFWCSTLTVAFSAEQGPPVRSTGPWFILGVIVVLPVSGVVAILICALARRTRPLLIGLVWIVAIGYLVRQSWVRSDPILRVRSIVGDSSLPESSIVAYFSGFALDEGEIEYGTIALHPGQLDQLAGDGVLTRSDTALPHAMRLVLPSDLDGSRSAGSIATFVRGRYVFVATESPARLYFATSPPRPPE